VYLVIDRQTEQIAIPNAQGKFVLFFWDQTIINCKSLLSRKNGLKVL
jgi:hypothetical protein